MKTQIEHVRFSIRRGGVLLPGKQMSRVVSASVFLPTSLLLLVVLGRLLIMFTSCAERNKISGENSRAKKEEASARTGIKGASQQGPETLKWKIKQSLSC